MKPQKTQKTAKNTDRDGAGRPRLAAARLKPCRILCSLWLTAAALAANAQSAAAEDEDYEMNYAAAAACGVLPQGGSRVHGGAGAAAMLGRYVEGFLAAEAVAAFAGGEAGIGVRGLWHWWGYEKFDPFFTFGARGWFDGDAGPCAGFGVFWHFDDNWSLRFDADAMLGVCADDSAMAYTFSAGLQYSF